VEEAYNHQITDVVNGISSSSSNIIVEKARPMTTEGNGRGGIRSNKDSKKRIMSSGASGRISSNLNPILSSGQTSSNHLLPPPAALPKENSKSKLQEHEQK
jgi:hypothetical protein